MSSFVYKEAYYYGQLYTWLDGTIALNLLDYNFGNPETQKKIFLIGTIGCIHKYKILTTTSKTRTDYQCTECGYSYTVDSSD